MRNEALEKASAEMSYHGSYLYGFLKSAVITKMVTDSSALEEALDGFAKARQDIYDARYPRAVPDPEEAA
jgi:hypothetical protein